MTGDSEPFTTGESAPSGLASHTPNPNHEPREQSFSPASAPQDVKKVRTRLSVGGLLFWGGTVSIGLSTAIILAALSRHLHHEGFASLSTLVGLFFVASLIPSGVPLRSAALEVDGAPGITMTFRHYAALVIAGSAISPPIAIALHLPAFTVFCVAAQVIVAIPLANRRGLLIAVHRFDSMGLNLLLEGGTRVVLGTVAGLLWGLDGVSLALAFATAVALVTVPRTSHKSDRTVRQMTSMFDTWISLLLVGLFVQIDVLIAPSVMSHASATHYDLAAVISRGVYVVLVAASTLIFPYVRVQASRRPAVTWSIVTIGIGLAITGGLILLRRTIASVLQQHIASLPLLVMLGIAMSIAGATGIVISGGIALGVRRPWPPVLLGMACVIAFGLSHPTPLEFGTVVLCAQAGALVTTSVVCLRARPTTGGDAAALRRL